jgi:hypothetical protein
MLELLFRVVFGWFDSLYPSGFRFIWTVKFFFRLIQ